MPDLPTLLFVPGAWHKPSCYDKITTILQEKHGLRCISITLPSTKGDPSATFKDDLDTAREAISTETSQGRDVVVIAHSYGGVVGNSAIKGFARPRGAASSTSTPSTGHVIGLILIASGYSLTGLSFMDPFFGHPPPSWRINKATGYAEIIVDTNEFFYHDLPLEEAEFWTSQLTPQSLKALFEGGEYVYAGWRDVPSWYIGTVEDRGLPVVVQRMQIGMAREMGGKVEHRELQTSHSPFLSRPEETAGLVLEAVESFVGTWIGNKPKGGVQAGVIFPAPRFWRPLTWFRFGLPLVFGHMFGRSYLVFTGLRGLWRSQ